MQSAHSVVRCDAVLDVDARCAEEREASAAVAFANTVLVFEVAVRSGRSRARPAIAKSGVPAARDQPNEAQVGCCSRAHPGRLVIVMQPVALNDGGCTFIRLKRDPGRRGPRVRNV